MKDLGPIHPVLKSGNEKFTFKGEKQNYELADFWKWSVSDLVSNATRGILAEFIVGKALGIDFGEVRNEWGAYDLKTKDGIKVEVKASSFIQSWFQKKFSTIQFSIKKSRKWDPLTNKQGKEFKRHVDAYIFCLLKHKEQKTIDPLNLDQWEFYVLSVEEINNYERSQSSITLESLKKMTDSVKYNEIKNELRKKMATGKKLPQVKKVKEHGLDMNNPFVRDEVTMDGTIKALRKVKLDNLKD